jgi:hypothetical protein
MSKTRTSKSRYLAIGSVLASALRKRGEDDSDYPISDKDTLTEVPPVSAPEPAPVVDEYELAIAPDGLYYFPNLDEGKIDTAEYWEVRLLRVMQGVNGRDLEKALSHLRTVRPNDLPENVYIAVYNNLAVVDPSKLLYMYRRTNSNIGWDIVSNAITNNLRSDQTNPDILWNVFSSVPKESKVKAYIENKDLVNGILRLFDSGKVFNLFIRTRGNVPPMFAIWNAVVDGELEELRNILEEKLKGANLSPTLIYLNSVYKVFPEETKEVLLGKETLFQSVKAVIQMASVYPEVRRHLLNLDLDIKDLFYIYIEFFKSLFSEEERQEIYRSLPQRKGNSSAANFFHALYFGVDEPLEFVMREIPQSILDELASGSEGYLSGLGSSGGSLLHKMRKAGRKFSDKIERNMLKSLLEHSRLDELSKSDIFELLVEKYGVDNSLFVEMLMSSRIRTRSVKPDSLMGELIATALDDLMGSHKVKNGDWMHHILSGNLFYLSEFITPKKETLSTIIDYADNVFVKSDDYRTINEEHDSLATKSGLLSFFSSIARRSTDRKIDNDLAGKYLTAAEDLFGDGFKPELGTVASRVTERDISINRNHLAEIKGFSLLSHLEDPTEETIKRYVNLLASVDSKALFYKGKSGAHAFRSLQEYTSYMRGLVGEKTWDEIGEEIRAGFKKRFESEAFASTPVIADYPEFFDKAVKNMNLAGLGPKTVIHDMLGKAFRQILGGDISFISDESYKTINNKLIESITDGTLDEYINLYRSTRGFGRPRVWFLRDPQFLSTAMKKIVEEFPGEFMARIRKGDYSNESYRELIRSAIKNLKPIFFDAIGMLTDLDAFSSFIRAGNEDLLLDILKAIQGRHGGLYSVKEFLNDTELWGVLENNEDVLNGFMRHAHRVSQRDFMRDVREDPKLRALFEKSSFKYSAVWLRQTEDYEEAKKMYPRVENDLKVTDLPDNIRITESIYQGEQRSEVFKSTFGTRYTISNNNVDPTKISYAVGKNLIHAGDGVDHTNVGMSGFTNSWALASIGEINPQGIGTLEVLRREPKKVVPPNDSSVPIIIIEQYQSDYPPLYSLIFDENNPDYDPDLKDSLIEDYGVEAFRDFTKHLDYINKAYPYLAIINTIETAKKLGAPYIYIHDYEEVVRNAHIENKEKAAKLYRDIPMLVATEKAEIRISTSWYGELDEVAEPIWKIPANDSVIEKMREEIKKSTGKGPEYDFSRTPKQNADIAKALRERLKMDTRSKWNAAEENVTKLESVKQELISRLETDEKDFSLVDIERLSTPTEVLIYLGKIRQQYGRGEFKKKFGLINRSLGMLSRAAKIFNRMIKLSTLLVASRNHRIRSLDSLLRGILNP